MEHRHLAVHWLREEFIFESLFTGSVREWTEVIDLSTAGAKFYYAGKILDHALLVGAVGSFLAGIRAFKEKAVKESER